MELEDKRKLKFTEASGQRIISKKVTGNSKKSNSSSLERLSIFHSGTSIKGNFTSSDNLYFSGTLVGDIKLGKKLVLGEKSDIKGNISALNLIVLGKVEGDINIRGKVIFGSKSSFKGKLFAETIEVREGAVFNAQCIALSPRYSSEETAEQTPSDIDLGQDSFIENTNLDKDDAAFFFKIFQNQ